MSSHRRLILLALLPVAFSFACEDDIDPFDGFDIVSGEHEAVTVAVVDDSQVSDVLVTSYRDLPGPSGAAIVATAAISPAIVPVSYSAYASPSDDRVSVIVEIDAEYVTEIDRVEVLVAVGSGESISGIELDEDALTPGRFFAFLKPSCLTELRSEDGTCQLDSIEDCAVEVEDSTETVQGRCDAFTFRLWRDAGNDSDASPTPTATPDGVVRSDLMWTRSD